MAGSFVCTYIFYLENITPNSDLITIVAGNLLFGALTADVLLPDVNWDPAIFRAVYIYNPDVQLRLITAIPADISLYAILFHEARVKNDWDIFFLFSFKLYCKSPKTHLLNEF